MNLTRADFPDDFLFGVATSSYQIEGHSFGGAGPTHWDTYAATPGNVVRAENGDVACDHYHRLDEDLDLIAGLGADVYRFSASWARVLPQGRGVPNEAGLDFYDRLVDGCLARGIKPLVTLYHWELPAALADMGGWTNADIPEWFADYAQVLMARIGDRVWPTATINELWCVAWNGHFLGRHAPGLRDIRATARAMHHVLKAHGRGVEALRAMGIGNLGAVTNLDWVMTADDSPEAQAAADRYSATFNEWFLGGMFKGAYPELALEGLGPHLPKGWEDDFETIGAPLDWLGINYYSRKLVAPDPGPWPSYQYFDGPLPKTSMGWEIYPDGLHGILNWVTQNYTGDLPLHITENGMSWPDEVGVPDTHRIKFLEDHLNACRRAIADGVPLKGYYTWSLMDNYEWARGYEKRFGLVHVDFETLARTPKASYDALASWWRTRSA
ncbi:MAG: GH1 family beta-glucosidase [Pseudomonadota bacterium]